MITVVLYSLLGSNLQSVRCGVQYLKNRNIKCGSEAGEVLWLLVVTFSSGIWQQAHGRAQLFDEYFESVGPKDSAWHMLPSVFALWNDNVALLKKKKKKAPKLPFLATWKYHRINMEELATSMWRCRFVFLIELPMSVNSQCSRLW